MGRRRDYTTTRNVELAWLLLVALAVGMLVGLLIGLLIALPVGRIGGNCVSEKSRWWPDEAYEALGTRRGRLFSRRAHPNSRLRRCPGHFFKQSLEGELCELRPYGIL